MTHLHLYQIEKFSELFADPRFMALMMYLEKQRPRITQKEPHGMIQDSGRLEAYLELIEKIHAVQRPPTTSEPIVRVSAPYQTSPNFPENKA